MISDFMKEEEWGASFQDTMLKMVQSAIALKYLPERCYLFFVSVER